MLFKDNIIKVFKGDVVADNKYFEASFEKRKKLLFCFSGALHADVRQLYKNAIGIENVSSFIVEFEKELPVNKNLKNYISPYHNSSVLYFFQ